MLSAQRSAARSFSPPLAAGRLATRRQKWPACSRKPWIPVLRAFTCVRPPSALSTAPVIATAPVVGTAPVIATASVVSTAPEVATAAAVGAAPECAVTKLENLTSMLDSGLITQKDYDAKKAQILAAM